MEKNKLKIFPLTLYIIAARKERKEGEREGEGKEDRGLGKKGEGAHRAGKAGPNLAVSYFRTVPQGPRTRDTGGGESGCANAPNPQLL